MTRNNGDMTIESSTFISFESSASTTYFQCIHLPVCQLPVCVYWVREFNEGQKYCRMLQGEHSVILSTFIKLPFVIKTFVFSFEWPLKTGFTVFS